MEEVHYSSEEEEVFFGSLAQSEVSKRRRFLGDNYNSPVTPRPPRFNNTLGRAHGNLPDVLSASSTSTPVQRQLSVASSCNNKSTPGDSPVEGSNDDDDDVIVLDCSRNSDSVIILSDDESFVTNEEICRGMSLRSNNENESMVKEPGSVSDFSHKDETVEISKLHNESFGSNKGLDKSPHKSSINNSESAVNIESINSSLEYVETKTSNNSCESKTNFENSNSSLVQNIIDFGDGESGNTVKECSSLSDTFNKDTTAETSKMSCEVLFYDKNNLIDSVTAEDKNSEKSGICNSQSQNSSLIYVETKSTNESCELQSNLDNSSSSLVQRINNFVGDSSDLGKNYHSINQITVGHTSVTSNNPQNLNLSFGVSASESKAPEISISRTSESTFAELPELQKNTKTIEEISDSCTKKHGKNSFDLSGLTNLEFSLNGMTDSILNISHGSSLPSPPDTCHTTSPVFQKPTVYEDISCDGDQLQTSNVAEKTDQDNEDLHMSVDEVDFQLQRFTNDFDASCIEGTSTINISQPSEYKSCSSVCNSYNTTFNRTYEETIHSTSEQSDSFQNYRDISTDLDILNETEENINEHSFEMVMQNRQNSFNGTPGSKMSSINKEGEPKTMSKLPVYQSSKSLLRPPVLCVKPDTLKTTSYKFSKQKVESGKFNSNLPKLQGSFKFSGPKPLNVNKQHSVKEKKTPLKKEQTFTNSPAKVITPKQSSLAKTKTPLQTSSLTKIKTPSMSYLPVSNTSAQNIVKKTPAQTIVSKTPVNHTLNKTPAQNKSGIPRAIKSDSKVMRVLTPLSNCNSSEKNCGNNSSLKNKYRNVISPIHAYIRGSPPVCQRKAQVINEELEVYSPDGKMVHQSTSQKVTPMKSAPKIVMKLKYENAQEQENVNPNALNLTRDTIPCKVLEPSLAVFWKEQEPQTHLPKMGEKLTKILAGPPKIKVTVHEGRVNQSPNSKGILIPNKENSPFSLTNPTSSDDNLPEGRISVRLQKTVELP